MDWKDPGASSEFKAELVTLSEETGRDPQKQELLDNSFGPWHESDASSPKSVGLTAPPFTCATS